MIEQEIYTNAILKWGSDLQVTVTMEECAELIKALSKFKRNPKGEEELLSVCEEIADVEIMIGQLKLMFNPLLVEQKKRDKLGRLKSIILKDGEK